MSPDTSPQEDGSLVGKVVCGCEVLELIGQGGMGDVYRARQVSLDRIVTLKVLAPSLGANTEFLGRFSREARSLANLVHPNIVAVHDFGSEGAVHGIVMEFVPGESVADMLDREAVIPLAAAVDIVRQVAEGLACAHRQQIIHCDLKPENILVTPEGVAKVVDFGLAKSLRGDAVRITQDGAILGTPTYMSPEQTEGEPLDSRSDIYSLGASFYRMVAGRDAFEGDNPFAIMLKHNSEPPPNPRDFNPEIPHAVAAAILRMMEKRCEDRYQTAEEVAAALASTERPAGGPADRPRPTESPRRDFFFVREGLDAAIITVAQVRDGLDFQDELRKVDVDEPLASLMLKRGTVSEEQLAELKSHEEIREAARRDRQLTQFVLESGLASGDQVAHCVQRYQKRLAADRSLKLSTVMIDLGVLAKRDVVRLLVRQLKEAQRSEDEEFLAALRQKQLVSEAQIGRCVRKQETEEKEGHPKVLRQIVVELGILSASEVRDLLRQSARSEIEAHLAQVEASQAHATGEIVLDEDALKVRDAEPCPACGVPVELGVKLCPTCGSDVEEARREAARRGVAVLEPGRPKAGARAAAKPPGKPRRAGAEPEGTPEGKEAAAKGEWELRLPDGEPSKPIRLDLLVKLARERRLRAQTVLRGPLTRGIWRQARHTPTLCRLFGVCHYCEERIPPKTVNCPACGAPIDRPVED